MNSSQTPSRNPVDDAAEQFLREGFDGYLDVVRCTHYFQTVVCGKVQSVLHSKRKRVASVLKLGDTIPEIKLCVHPQFADEKYDNSECSLGAYMPLAAPYRYPGELVLLVNFEEPARTLFCVLELQRRRDFELVRELFHDREDRFEDKWDGHVVGLKRVLRSRDNLRDELVELLDSFLECCEKNVT